jgi:FK506-binding nuclear protein
MDADDSSDAACFWGYEIPPGGKLSQHVSRHACVCLTGAVLATPSTERAVLRATSGGYSAVLCNLFGSGVHDTAKLGQPFNADFELMVDGASTSAVHVSGFSRGELGPVEIETAEKRPAPVSAKAPAPAAPAKAAAPAAAGKAAAPAAAAKKAVPAAAAKTAAPAANTASSTIAGRAKAVAPEALMGVEEDDDEDGDDDEEEGEEEEGEEEEGEEEEGEEEEGEEEEGEEEEGEEEEDDDDEDEEDEEEGGMPLAPPSVEAILKGTSGAKRAAAAAAPPSKKGKSTHETAQPTAPPPKPAPLAAAKPAAPAPAPASKGGFVKIAGGVEYEDVQLGAMSGGVARNGQKVTVKYVGTLTNGKRFDAGDISFRLGAGEVIKGWDLGVAGMRVGGKRKLRIPPDAAYGKRGAPPTIPPNATLLFDVELMRC